MVERLIKKTANILRLLGYEENRSCLLCNQAGSLICDNCKNLYFLPSSKRCKGCGKIIDEKEICVDCESGKGPKGLSGVSTLGHYQGSWKNFIHNVKYMNQPYLLVVLEEYISACAVENLPPPDCIVPIPMHPERLALRGFNQAEVLASVLSTGLGINYRQLIIRSKNTVPQTSLGRQERIENLQGAFKLKGEPTIFGQVIWIVDDVITTGATVGECAKTLREGGAKEVFAFCLGAGREEIKSIYQDLWEYCQNVPNKIGLLNH